MLWEVDIYPRAGLPDRVAERLAAAAAELGLFTDGGPLCERGSPPEGKRSDPPPIAAAHGYLIQGPAVDATQAERLAAELLADGVVERTVVAEVGEPVLNDPPAPGQRLVHVLPKPGVMDPVALSAQRAMAEMGIEAEVVRTLRKYWLGELSDDDLHRLAARVLANDAIEQVIVGPLPFKQLDVGAGYHFELVTVPILDLDADGLARLSREGQLYLQPAEMEVIQKHYRALGREPTDAELETLAQTWSEHCSHKTLAGRIAYRDEQGERRFENMLRETIFAATEQIRADLGPDDWCVSVFKDNAGIVRFDEQFNVAFKVETHNHPSALEPYGGANTGIGGVIRDTLGTGLAARPVASTDVFCFAPPDMPPDELPPGILHPRRVMRGVVSGVRDYGNRMGIPTVNGAIYFDRRYLGNPLVYCGNVGIIPRDKSQGEPQAGDLIVAVGGRTGRDGIHGATFSSVELTSQSEDLSGGAVQIGNAITEKMVLDVVLAARDRNLFRAITDCGAGGFSSAVGEMGEAIGAEVWLERAPVKYEGLSYTEIWISEAQERMVLAVPPEQWDELAALCQAEGVEATEIGRFVPTGRLVLQYDGQQVADLPMSFLHDGRPPVVREAIYEPAAVAPLEIVEPPAGEETAHYTDLLLRMLASLNVASKEWVIRQYDHEVQGGSVIKPLVGAASDGPGDAAVLRPVLGSRRGLVIGCGMNPRYGDLDTYHMATSAIDEAVRNCVAVGGDPRRIAILDNFCWGDCEKPATLGSLVRAALACHDLAVVLQTPFISGKDSLNNEFSYEDADGRRQTIAIPPSLLISALGQVDDVADCVTMDLKQPGNLLYLVGATRDELGGSHYGLVAELEGGRVPQVDPQQARATFAALHEAIAAGHVRACHDLSEGGLAVAAAEMAFAGGLGARLQLNLVPHALQTEGESAAEGDASALPLGDDAESTHPLARQPGATTILLFSESNTRFLCEVPPQSALAFEAALSGVPHAAVGQVTDEGQLQIARLGGDDLAIDAEIGELKEAWQAPLRW